MAQMLKANKTTELQHLIRAKCASLYINYTCIIFYMHLHHCLFHINIYYNIFPNHRRNHFISSVMVAHKLIVYYVKFISMFYSYLPNYHIPPLLSSQPKT